MSRDTRISMDGRGGTLDNVFVERPWRTVKKEEVYITDYFQFYNSEPLRQSLGYRTPEAVHRGATG